MEQSKFRMDGKLNNGLYTLINSDYNAIIGVETASGYWGLSTFSPDYAIMLFNDNNKNSDGYFIDNVGTHILFVPDVNLENIVNLSEHLRITDLEQTVVDMVRYNRHEFHLYETLISAIDDKMADLDRLEKLARQYNVWDKMQELLKEALIAEEEDNE